MHLESQLVRFRPRTIKRPSSKFRVPSLFTALHFRWSGLFMHLVALYPVEPVPVLFPASSFWQLAVLRTRNRWRSQVPTETCVGRGFFPLGTPHHHAKASQTPGGAFSHGSPDHHAGLAAPPSVLLQPCTGSAPGRALAARVKEARPLGSRP